MSVRITICPNLVNFVAVSTTINPVTHTAEVEVKRQSTHDIGVTVAKGSFNRHVPIKIARRKLKTVSLKGVRNSFNALNNITSQIPALVFPRHAQRLLPTPYLAHNFSTSHLLHQGDTGWQTFWPKGTKRSLISIQYSRGNNFFSSFSVCSGVFVLIQPSLLDIL